MNILRCIIPTIQTSDLIEKLKSFNFERTHNNNKIEPICLVGQGKFFTHSDLMTALNAIFSNMKPILHTVALNIETKAHENLDIHSGEPNLVTTANGDVLVTCLSLFAAKLQRFPTSSEVLLCSENTTGMTL